MIQNDPHKDAMIPYS